MKSKVAVIVTLAAIFFVSNLFSATKGDMQIKNLEKQVEKGEIPPELVPPGLFDKGGMYAMSEFPNPPEYITYVEYTQDQNISFDEIGDGHIFLGQLITPENDIIVMVLNVELSQSSGNPVGRAEIWQTDIGDNWTNLTYTDSQSITGSYTLRTWEFLNPVTLHSNRSYFVGAYITNGTVLVRGDDNGYAGGGTDLGDGVGSPNGYYQESWGSPSNTNRTGNGTEYVTTFSILVEYPTSQFEPQETLIPGDQDNLVWIKPGNFTMGDQYEEPLNRVTISSGFYIGKYEVTQGEYLDVIDSNPSCMINFDGLERPIGEDLNRPVENVTWYQATNYCYVLTLRERMAGRLPQDWHFRLPTSAEWEYACRAGTTTLYHYGDVLTGDMANYWFDYYQALWGTITVGSYQPNAWGLYDMHGNVSEWVKDWFPVDTSTTIDPQGPTSGTWHQVRGGGWGCPSIVCESKYVSNGEPQQTPCQLGFRIVKSSVIRDWQAVIEAEPPQPAYGTCPIKEEGKDSLVVVTHGWVPKVPMFDQNPPENIEWVDDMTEGISDYLIAEESSNWQVYGHKWIVDAWKIKPDDALDNAASQGVKLGECLMNQGWSHIHLIGHSAGAGLIQATCDTIKTNGYNPVIHLTFLDAFVGFDYYGLQAYGMNSTWAESYYCRDLFGDGDGIWKFTEGVMENAYNVNVTYLHPHKVEVKKFRSQETGQIEPCIRTIATHKWPREFYLDTIVSGNPPQEYEGFGFPMSKEVQGNNWRTSISGLTKGDEHDPLGTPDPDCTNDPTPVPVPYMDSIVDFTELPAIESTTGEIQKWIDSLNLISGSPAWISSIVTPTNPVNFVSFNAHFTSTNNEATGLLSVYWDTNSIGSIDERVVGNQTRSYRYTFPRALVGTSHILGFRLDPFTNIQSSVILTNIILGQIGVSEPFTISRTTNSVGGVKVYELVGQPGYEYTVQASTNLIDWTDIALLANTNGVVKFYDEDSTNNAHRFYRGVAPY